MNDMNREDFDKVLTAFFGVYGREAKPHHLAGWWSVLRGFTLEEVRAACRDIEAESLPNAKRMAAYIRSRGRRPDEKAPETRTYHYARPGDVRCRRCMRPVDRMEDGETCPPAGAKLRRVYPPSGTTDAAIADRQRWYADREAEFRGVPLPEPRDAREINADCEIT